MPDNTELQQKIDTLARDVLTLSRNTLLVNLRFLDAALSRFELYPYDGTFATDGQLLLYGAKHILKSYKSEKEAVVRDYLHIVMHCVFRHMFVHTLINQECWDLACDIAAEYCISGLGLKSADSGRARHQQAVYDELQQNIKMLTAEKIYRYYLDKKLPKAKLADLRGLFYADDHFIWYLTGEEKQKYLGLSGSGQSEESENDEPGEGDNSEDNDNPGEDAGNNDESESGLSLLPDPVEEDWKDVAERMQMDMETFSKQQGDRAGGMMQNLREVNREKYDYTAFLKKFAVMGEAMKINDDEFDYIFYTYGLQLYKKVPLIEPLEYKEVKRIKEFVIAIDTSGSTSGELVQKFVQKTYNVLKSTESFFSKINLHIIQCDADIQEDAKITSQEEFDEYLKHMQIHGLGGTDFCPVFSYVDELRRKKEFTNLRGLIYFTDGYGEFPAKKPDYDTAFVFVDDDYGNPDVPSWAIKLVLGKEEI